MGCESIHSRVLSWLSFALYDPADVMTERRHVL